MFSSKSIICNIYLIFLSLNITFLLIGPPSFCKCPCDSDQYTRFSLTCTNILHLRPFFATAPIQGLLFFAREWESLYFYTFLIKKKNVYEAIRFIFKSISLSFNCLAKNGLLKCMQCCTLDGNRVQLYYAMIIYC